jgi:hypothetical protein
MEVKAEPLPVTRGRLDRLAHGYRKPEPATAVLPVVSPVAAAADQAQPANPVVPCYPRWRTGQFCAPPRHHPEKGDLRWS